MGQNRFATSSKRVAAKKGGAAKPKPKAEARRPLDDYETPEDKTAYLGIVDFAGPIFEPAAGSGRMVRQLRKMYPKRKIVASDIKDGKDFLARTKAFAGDIITNPPYNKGRADAFVAKALELADGKVAMLMQAGFLFGDKRNRTLYSQVRPSHIIIIPERILFFKGGTEKLIEGQFYSNVWLVFPDRKTREKGKYQTVTLWPTPPEKELTKAAAAKLARAERKKALPPPAPAEGDDLEFG